MYTVMQRMRKQWIKRTYGVDKKGKRGSHYKAVLGGLNTISPTTDIFTFEIEYTNTDQCPQSKFQDLRALAVYFKSLEFKTQLSEKERETVRNTIDYDTFARAQVIGYYANDGDGYFGSGNHNFEWYHDSVIEKWRLLLWDFDNGFKSGPTLHSQLFTMNYDIVLKTLLLDPSVATVVLPSFNVDKKGGEKPNWVKRFEIFWSLVTDPRYETIDRRGGGGGGGDNDPDYLILPNHLLGIVNQASRQALEVLEETLDEPTTSNIKPPWVTFIFNYFASLFL
eukprot:Pgem_evm1s5558